MKKSYGMDLLDFMKKPFDEGTGFVVKAVKNNKNKNFFSVAGGGDTISLLKQVNAFQYFSFIYGRRCLS